MALILFDRLAEALGASAEEAPLLEAADGSVVRGAAAALRLEGAAHFTVKLFQEGAAATPPPPPWVSVARKWFDAGEAPSPETDFCERRRRRKSRWWRTRPRRVPCSGSSCPA